MIINPSNAKDVLLQKKLYIFDMDGTIYLGDRAFPFAVDFINRLREHGKKILFFTNNASKNPEAYMNKLKTLGFKPKAEELLYSAHVTIDHIQHYYPDARVYLVGTPELWEQFRCAGINLICDRSGIQTEDEADIVITSFDTTLTYHKLSAACNFIRSGALYLCTHPDFNCPAENGYIPDSGSIAALITASTGAKPEFFGKPYKSTADYITKKTGIPSKDCCLFGDRLYTDIAMGAHGITSVLVLTGEGTMEEALSLPGKTKPDFIFESLETVDTLLFL